MTIKNILVPLDGTDATRPALEIALSVARKVKAHVDVLHVKTDSKSVVPLLGEGMSGNMIEEMIEFAEKETEERSTNARALFDSKCSEMDIPVANAPDGNGPSARWVETVGREEEIVAKIGRLADMIVVPLPGPDPEPSVAMTVNAALFETGRLVLLAPAKTPASFAGEKAAIAWNGSVQSARALTAAMPLIENAKSTVIMTAESLRTEAEGATQLAESLGWRGLAVESMILEESGGPVGSELLKACKENGTDFIVMGAYTRSRLRQWILGGVTSYVLENAELPVLMAR
jgi:nucleotide-binding universal stress UspA family protein